VELSRVCGKSSQSQFVLNATRVLVVCYAGVFSQYIIARLTAIEELITWPFPILLILSTNGMFVEKHYLGTCGEFAANGMTTRLLVACAIEKQ
jgi:hypothetical protein